MVKSFYHGPSLGLKNGSITFNHRQKDSQLNGNVQLLLGRRSLRLPLQQGVTAAVFGKQKG
jgi:hypothetical protein